MYVVFPLKVQSHLAECELPHATEMDGNRINFTPSGVDCGKPCDSGGISLELTPDTLSC
jgi:hypothetical protein